MNYVLNARPGVFRIKGSVSRGSLGAGYTGRRIDVENGYALAKRWRDAYETSCDRLVECEDRFLASIASVAEAKLDIPLFRGRIFDHPPISPFEFGPPPAERTPRGRYNKAGQPLLYLCSSASGVSRELDLPTPGSSLWVQRFHFPLDLKILDVTSLSEDSYASAIFWVIESSHDRSLSGPPRLGTRVAELISSSYDGMLVPGVRGEPGNLYSNVVIFRPLDQWKDYLDAALPPQCIA